MVNSRVLSLLLKVYIIVDMFGCFLLFLAIVGAFAEALISLDADGKTRKTSDTG